MPSRIERFAPSTPLARRLSVRSVLFATGQGAFLTGSAVSFTPVVGLSAVRVGLALTVIVLAPIGTGPSSRAAERYLARAQQPTAA